LLNTHQGRAMGKSYTCSKESGAQANKEYCYLSIVF
jgi:hypothetical protein